MFQNRLGENVSVSVRVCCGLGCKHTPVCVLELLVTAERAPVMKRRRRRREKKRERERGRERERERECRERKRAEIR